MEKEVLAVRRGELFKGGCNFEGFKTREVMRKSRIERNIEEYGQFLPREVLENNPEYKQIVVYGVLFNADSQAVFSYRRGATEKRLEGSCSIGIGSHVHPVDSRAGAIRSNMIQSISRETNAVSHMETLQLAGYINYEDSAVNRDHFGVLFLAEVFSPRDIVALSPNIRYGKFREINEIQRLMNQHQFEEWSEIAYKILKREKLLA